MRITGITSECRSFPLKVPFVTALRRVDTINALHFRITTDEKLSGDGAASPTAAITGDTDSSIKEAVRIIEAKLIGRDVEHLNDLTATVASSLAGNFSAKAAVDMALYDLFAKRAGVPLYSMLGGSIKPLETDLTISLGDRDTMVTNAISGEKLGMTALKIKLGMDIEEDFARFVAIRNAVSCALRIDANQGWSVRDTLSFMDRCDRRGIDVNLLEQPVNKNNLEGMRRIRDRISCPLAADESVFSALDALRVADAGAADVINVKLMKCGGIAQALKIAAVAETCGLDLMFGCMAESPLGIAAVVHLASALPNVKYLDLDVPFLMKDIPEDYGFRCDGLRLIAKDTCGLSKAY
jgi:L-alanine-DL-glutamate epimerase-like enolase superfamily enzyme